MRRMLIRVLVLSVVFVPTVLSSVWSPGVRAQSAQSPFPDLVGALKATPGCFGVETARTGSGKQVIFAWFENKQAVMAWYNSDTHQALLRQFSGEMRRPGGPLAGVPDDGRPILAIASLTMPALPRDGDVRSATTQIAIELYTPVPGGVAAGGRFAPSTVKVPGLLELPSTTRSAPARNQE